MLAFASEVSELVHGIGALDEVGVKVAEADVASVSQLAAAHSSNMLYDVIYKQAMAETPVDWPNHFRVASFVSKMASTLRKPEVQSSQMHKMAAAVKVDDSLTSIMPTASGEGLQKLAEVRSFGREYFMELLREVL